MLMTKETIQKTRIFNENDLIFNNEWFSYKKASFISHVDTFYFLITPACKNWNNNEQKNKLIDTIRTIKQSAEIEREAKPIFEDLYKGLEVQPYFGIQMYSYHFGLKDNFDIFICDSIPNSKTPPIMIQVRAQSLWLNGLKKSFDTACDCIEKVLYHYGLQIESVQENRIDYAFHTNYIQDMMNFFPEKHLKHMQVSNFARWHKEGYFYGDDVISDYFTLGRRKSNNVFFRTYNKTQEVIEMGYKQFFIPIWVDNGLISKFDEYILKRAFVHGTYASKDKARCEFYSEYGKDLDLKYEIIIHLNDPDTPSQWYAKTAKGLVPDLTVVTNVELQTKRKFYDRLKTSIPFIVDDNTYRKNIYNMFAQLSCYINFLTHETIRFVRYKGAYKDIPRIESPYADWWKRLRSSKPLEYTEEWIIDYFREYQNNLDTERQKVMSIKKMACMAAYMKYDSDYSSNVSVDFNEFLSTLNDNDIKKYYKARDKKIKEIRRLKDEDKWIKI